MAGRRVDRFGGAIAAAIVRRAQMRPAFQHLARNPDPWLAGVVARYDAIEIIAVGAESCLYVCGSHPSHIQGKLDRRLSVARDANPTKQREEGLRRDLARLQKSMDRLMTAYLEDLLSLDDLRRRMPELREREQAIEAELSSLLTRLADRAGF